MTGIGIYSSKKSHHTSQDYILANRSVGPIATSLSAVSTCHSGFMFIGMIGFTYTIGISAIWLIISWMIGDYIAWKYVYSPLRKKTEQLDVSTISSFISHHLPHQKKRLIQIISGTFILIFLSVYAAAQLTAGSKALHVMLGWPINTSILIGAVIVLAYSFSGGIRASIWTDVVQSIIMLISMSGLLVVAIWTIGGPTALFHQLNAIQPNLTSLIPSNLTFGFLPYLAGWIAFGLGVIGQPHIVVRPMAISSPTQLNTARRLYLSWYGIFSMCAIGVGLSARVLLPELASADQELALPVLATQLLPSIFVGGILAGLFSATISTADSQVLSCSAALTQDINPAWKRKLTMSKVSTLLVMIVTVLIALYGSKNVYALVILAWSALSVVLGPLIACKCMNIHVGFKTSLSMMLGSLFTIITWSQFKLSGSINEVLPGAIVAVIICATSQYVASKKNT